MIEPSRLNSMVAAIVLGTTLPEAIAKGLVADTPEEREVWRKLAAETKAIQDAGLQPALFVDPLV